MGHLDDELEARVTKYNKTLSQLALEHSFPFLVDLPSHPKLTVFHKTNDGSYVVFSEAMGANTVFGDQPLYRLHVEPKKPREFWVVRDEAFQSEPEAREWAHNDRFEVIHVREVTSHFGTWVTTEDLKAASTRASERAKRSAVYGENWFDCFVEELGL